MRISTTSSSIVIVSAALALLLLLLQIDTALALSLPPSSSSSRRDWLFAQAPVAAVLLTYAYGRAGYNVWQNRGIRHPAEHEQRVQATITQTLLASAAKPGHGSSDPSLRVLEVGMGTDCRIVRRGLYSQGFQQIAMKAKRNGDHKVQTIQLVGVDVQRPSSTVLDEARQVLNNKSNNSNNNLTVDLQFLQHSIIEKLPFEDGYFDAILCCLTLCSVTDPVLAVREMNRLLRPTGGALGFVEHVAVDPGNEYDHERHLAWLEQQQLWLDPWQQRVAANCHLHRYTQQTLQQELTNAQLLTQERFLVNAMWPVSMQACGVFQKQG